MLIYLSKVKKEYKQQKMKNSRTFSFIIVALTYIVATLIGLVVYGVLPFEWWLNLFIADFVATAVVFCVSIAVNNSSVYDPYWSVQPIVILFALAIDKGLNLSSALVLVAVTFWGIRLTANWAYTFQNLNWQDWRYSMLKQKTKIFYPIVNFLGIHLFPTVVVYLCVLPAAYLIITKPQFNFFALFGALIVLFGSLLQGVADVQMHKYRKNRVGNFIRTGLWKHSRHPNYLGEITVWWGVAIACVFTVGGAYHLCLGAIVNTLMFLFVSIPMADKRQSKKAGFEEYKKQTRMLFPIPKKI